MRNMLNSVLIGAILAMFFCCVILLAGCGQEVVEVEKEVVVYRDSPTQTSVKEGAVVADTVDETKVAKVEEAEECEPPFPKDLSVPAEEIAEGFVRARKRFEQTYLGETFDVYGIVTEVHESDHTNYIILLGFDGIDVRFEFDKAKDIVGVEKGMEAKIKGMCVGETLSFHGWRPIIYFNYCRVIEKH